MAKRLQSEEDSKMAQALADADAGKKPSDSSDSSDDDIPDLEDKLTDEEKAAKYTQAMETKEAANALFKGGDNTGAISKWAEALGVIAPVKDWSSCSVDVADVRALRVSLHVNTAAAHNKLEQWSETLAAVEKCMSIDAGNAKAQFRRGVAYYGLGRLDEAKEDFTTVAKADPKNGAVRTELAKVKEALKVRKAEEKERMKGLFTGKGL